MMALSLVLAAALMAAPALALAQTQTANALTANAKLQFGALTGFVIRSAEKVPEDRCQLFGHVADALFSMCSTAGGAKPPRTGIEKTVTAKAELIAALKEGVSYCNTVFDGMTDQKGTETVPFYFGPTPRLSVLYFAVTHTYEHYGNLVTYMRLKNIVPPSSETPPKQ